MTWAEWDDVIDINLKGSFFLSTAFARQCRNRGRGGAVVSLASTHGLTGIAGRSVYGISKGGIVQMTRMLAIEWAPLGIRVNAVAPATVLTPSREKLLSDPEARARMLARIPLGRFPTMDEIAAAVCYLASDAAASDHRPDPGARRRPDGGVSAHFDRTSSTRCQCRPAPTSAPRNDIRDESRIENGGPLGAQLFELLGRQLLPVDLDDVEGVDGGRIFRQRALEPGTP